MNNEELLKTLEAATGKSSLAAATAAQVSETQQLRAGWERFAEELSAEDQRLHADDADFLARLASSLQIHEPDVALSETTVGPNAGRAAIVNCGRPSDEPLGWKGWLATVACVAIGSSLIFWYDFGAQQAEVSRTESSVAVQNSDQGSTESPAVAANGLEAPEQSPEPWPDIATNTSSAWTDSVDSEIADVQEQLLALQSGSKWDRSVLAFEQYRRSVEQEMNEWEL